MQLFVNLIACIGTFSHYIFSITWFRGRPWPPLAPSPLDFSLIYPPNVRKCVDRLILEEFSVIECGHFRNSKNWITNRSKYLSVLIYLPSPIIFASHSKSSNRILSSRGTLTSWIKESLWCLLWWCQNGLPKSKEYKSKYYKIFSLLAGIWFTEVYCCKIYSVLESKQKLHQNGKTWVKNRK